MALTLSVEGGPAGLEAFLVERARESWDTAVDIPRRSDVSVSMPAVTPGTEVFNVEIDWLSAEQLTVSVEQNGDQLTRRTIEVDDPVEAKLTLWLLLKSTINRGLKQSRLAADRNAVSGAPPLIAAAVPAAPVAAASDVTDAEVSDPQLPRPSAEVSSPAAPVRGPALSEHGAAPDDDANVRLRIGPWVTVWLETPRLLAVGVVAVATWYWRFLAFAVQFGYRYAPGPDGLEVHGVPVTGTAAFEIGERIRAGIGAMLTGELKIPVTRTRADVRLGAEGGVFAQARMGLAQEWEMALRFGIAWRMVRMRYLYNDSAGVERKTREAPWTTMLAMGVAWQ
jgi:hypothetical protein